MGCLSSFSGMLLSLHKASLHNIVFAQHRLSLAASKVQKRSALQHETLASKALSTHRLSTQLSIFLRAQGVW